jgi:hypothetical protein
MELIILYTVVCFSLLKSSSFFMYHQVCHSEILRDVHFVQCFVRISEQTVAFALYIFN